jgi:hypothetical protein
VVHVWVRVRPGKRNGHHVSEMQCEGKQNESRGEEVGAVKVGRCRDEDLGSRVPEFCGLDVCTVWVPRLQ